MNLGALLSGEKCLSRFPPRQIGPRVEARVRLIHKTCHKLTQKELQDLVIFTLAIHCQCKHSISDALPFKDRASHCPPFVA